MCLITGGVSKLKKNEKNCLVFVATLDTFQTLKIKGIFWGGFLDKRVFFSAEKKIELCLPMRPCSVAAETTLSVLFSYTFG